MHQTMRVMRQELMITLSRVSFLLFAFGIPLASVLILAGTKYFQSRAGNDGTQEPEAYQLNVEGYVDPAGRIQMVPPELEAYLLAFDSEPAAQSAMQSGEIAAYYLISEDYLASGEIIYVYPDSQSYLADGQDWIILRTLYFNLLDGDQALTDLVWNPIREMKEINITPQAASADASSECLRPGTACNSSETIRMIPALMVAIFYIALMASSSMLFNSIAAEKENRTIEVILLSINSRELLAGKIIALGIAGLLQTVMWLTSIYIIFNLGGSTLHLPEGFSFPVSIILWSVIFFLGGFALFASLMAGAGAMVPKLKEAGVASFIAMMPLLIGYMIGLMAPLVGHTQDLLLVFLSLFPLTSPVVMVMRMTDGTVPLWQIVFSAVLLYVTAYLIFRAVAAMFHAQNLLSGQPFSVKRYLRALVGWSTF